MKWMTHFLHGDKEQMIVHEQYLLNTVICWCNFGWKTMLEFWMPCPVTICLFGSLPVVCRYSLWRVRKGWQGVCFGQQQERWLLRVLASCSILVIGGNSPSASRSWLFGRNPNRLFEDPAWTLPHNHIDPKGGPTLLAPSGALIAIPTYYWPTSSTPLFQITPVLNTGLSLSEPLQLYKGYNAI